MSFCTLEVAGIVADFSPLKTYVATRSKFDNCRLDSVSSTTRAFVVSTCNVTYGTYNRRNNMIG